MSFDIFNPRKMPNIDDNLLDYGSAEIATLFEQFREVVASKEVCQRVEWISGIPKSECKFNEAQ